MISLEVHLNSLLYSLQVDAVRDMLAAAEAKITFWGSRVVEVNGFTGSVVLQEIAKKISGLSCIRPLTPDERDEGYTILGQLNNFYRITDKQIQNANFFTKLIFLIREFTLTPYTIRFSVEQGLF